MDSHVRERIVGAAVLVALGVWLIPWVLDGPESEPAAASGSAPELQLPSPDSATPTRTETVDLDPRPAAAQRVAGAAACEPLSQRPSECGCERRGQVDGAIVRGAALDGESPDQLGTGLGAKPALEGDRIGRELVQELPQVGIEQRLDALDLDPFRHRGDAELRLVHQLCAVPEVSRATIREPRMMAP